MKVLVTVTQEEAAELCKQAWLMVEKHTLGSYRFGQALWNLLPSSVTSPVSGTSIDFFYWQDSDKVTKTFYEHFVGE